MIDWYLILFLFTALIISLIHHIGNHESIKQYTMPPHKLGLHRGTILLLMRHVTGTAIVIAMYVTYKIGMFGGWIIALVGMFSFLIYFAFFRTIHPKYEMGWRNIIDAKLTTKSRKLFSFYTLLYQLEGVLIQLALSVYLFTNLFGISPFVMAGLMIAFSYIYAVIGGINGVRRAGFVILFTIFISAVTTSFSLYFTKGLDSVYLSLTELTAESRAGFSEIVLFCLLGIIVFLTRLFLDHYTTVSLSSTMEKYQGAVMGISVFAWMAIPLSFSIIMTYLEAEYGQMSFLTQLRLLFTETNGFASNLLIVGMLGAFSSGIGTSLQSMMSTISTSMREKVIAEESSIIARGYLIVFLISIFSILMIGKGVIGLKAIVFFYVLLYSSMFIPIVFVLMRHQKSGVILPTIVIPSFIVGFLFNWTSDQFLLSIGVAVTTSILTLITYLVLARFLK